MTISSRTPDGRPGRCAVCRTRLRLAPSWPTDDAPCPRCGSLVWFSPAKTRRPLAELPPVPDFPLEDFRRQFAQLATMGALADTEVEMRRIRGMIDAMTPEERSNPAVLNAS